MSIVVTHHHSVGGPGYHGVDQQAIIGYYVYCEGKNSSFRLSLATVYSLYQHGFVEKDWALVKTAVPVLSPLGEKKYIPSILTE